MRHATGIALFTSVALASAAAPQAARALEIDRLLGRWSSPDMDDCAHADDSEGAPLAIRRMEDEIWIGNYGWLCSVPVAEWKKDGEYLVASARGCGLEGGGDTFDEDFRLGLDADGRLLMAGGGSVAVFRRCPAAE
jgi:hypothetical protein